MSAWECIQCPIFDPYRDKAKEDFLKSMRKNPTKIELKIDSCDAFDYDKPENAVYTEKELRVLLIQEI